MFYTMKFGNIEHKLPICPLNDKLSIAGFIILGNAALSEECAKQLLEKAPEFDYIFTAEAKGIPLAQDMTRLAGKSQYIIARKSPKLYMSGYISVEVQSITTAKRQELFLDKAEADLIAGKKVLIVDDVISTGESLKAIESLVEKAGGVIVGKMAILAEGDAQTRDDIIYLQPLPLFDNEGNPLE